MLRRGVPVREIGGRLVTTVYRPAARPVRRRPAGTARKLAHLLRRPPAARTPAWQEQFTGVPAAAAAKIGREFAANAEESGGRSMIIMGAGTNHWFHSDTIYRAFLALTTLTGCQGVNGGGWAHYVGQEKLRPVTGWSTLAFGARLGPPAAADDPDRVLVPAHRPVALRPHDGRGASRRRWAPAGSPGRRPRTCSPQSARMGWMPSHPTFDRNPLDLADEIAASGQSPAEYVVERLKIGELRFACEDPDAPENFPRVLTIWRANLLGSSSKGNEYFLKHLLGTDSSLRATEAPPEARPQDVVWHEQAPTGKLDLLVNLDFRMTSTTVYSDVVLPAATWYEKHDLNTTDMHPFVHSFNPAIAPPWQTRTDFAIFKALSEEFSRQAATHLGVRKDLVAAPLTHDTPDEYANPHGIVRDWKAGECDPVPGVTHAQARGRRARLRRRRGEVGGAGAAGREARAADQGHGVDAGQGGRLPARQERRGARRRWRTAGRRWPATSTGARRSSRSPAPRTAGWRRRRSSGSRSAPGCGWPTSRPSTRAS